MNEIKEYKPLELDYNVHTAVENLKTAYWSNEPEKVATAFKEAEDIIISAICHHNYTVCKELQEVETERPQGEWIVTAEDNDGIHRIQCPFCRYEKGSDFIDYITVTFEKFPPFCENCGADMRGKEE